MKPALILAAALAVTTPAVAQDAAGDDGWDVQSAPDLQVAGVMFSSGVALIFRCQAWKLDAIITGLTPVEGGYTRVLEVSRPDGSFEDQVWRTAAEPSAAFSHEAERLARAARLGGVLSIRIPNENGQNGRLYRLDLPADPSGLDAALNACAVPLTDEADAVQPMHTRPENQISWQSRPTPMYPQRAFERGVRAGRAEVSCVVSLEGRLEDCEIVSEDPPGMGFGREALAAARQARLTLLPGRTAGEGRVNFPITFRMP